MPAVRAGVPEPPWDDDVLRRAGHFLQTAVWAGFQLRLGYPVLHASDAAWSWIAVIGQRLGFRYLYVPCGPVASADDLGEALRSVMTAAQRYRCDFIRIEPHLGNRATIGELGGIEVNQVQPKHTWILDVGADDATLRRGLSKGHKSSLSGASRHGISVEITTDLAAVADLVQLLRATQARTAYTAHSERYYQTLMSKLAPSGYARVGFSVVDGVRVAGALVYDFGSTRYYAYAGANEVSRRTSAAVPLVWELIRDGRDSGKQFFDFWGVAPDDSRNHPWAGISQFKRAFGGKPVDRLGTWEIPVRRLRHWAFRTAQRVQRG